MEIIKRGSKVTLSKDMYKGQRFKNIYVNTKMLKDAEDDVVFVVQSMSKKGFCMINCNDKTYRVHETMLDKIKDEDETTDSVKDDIEEVTKTEDKASDTDILSCDLKTGMVLESRDKTLYLLIGETLYAKNGTTSLSLYTDNLINYFSKDKDIVAVYETDCATSVENLLNKENLLLIWERNKHSKKLNDLKNKIDTLYEEYENAVREYEAFLRKIKC